MTNRAQHPDFQKLIHIHANYSMAAEEARSKGQPVPMHISQKIRECEQAAEAWLGHDPVALEQAGAMSKMVQTELGHQARLQHRAARTAEHLRNYRQGTKALGIPNQPDGLTPEQVQDIRDGKSHITVKERTLTGKTVEHKQPVDDRDHRKIMINDALDKHGGHEPSLDDDDIHENIRREAADSTSRIQHEVASEGRDPDGYMDRRDAIIQAMDKHSTEPAEA